MAEEKLSEKLSIIKKLNDMRQISDAMQIDFLEELDQKPEVKVFEKSIDKRIAETSEINQAYVQMMKKDPLSIHTAYAAIEILSKNGETTNDKFEVVGKMINELNKQVITLTKQQQDIVVVLQKLTKSLIGLVKDKQGLD
jgi:uncharacterized coiled-coil DUF342 family protein